MPPRPAGWVRTARVLRRAGFGTTGVEVDSLVDRDLTAYLTAALSSDPDADPGAVATPPPAPWTWDYDARFRQDRVNQIWWLRRMAAVRQPIHEKLTLVWHDHFATSHLKVEQPAWMLQQNQTIRRLCRGDFRELAYAMLVDPAMIDWLDGRWSGSWHPNENLSREFLELFTLGVDGPYTESDVKEGARALTGWRLDNASLDARFDSGAFDPGTKTVLGRTGAFGAREFSDAVVDSPACARHVATRLWLRLASQTPPGAATLERLVAAYGPRRDLSALTVAVLTDPEFEHASIVASPVEWAIGLVRALRVDLRSEEDAGGLADLLAQMGMQVFNPPSVGGWPSGTAWLSTVGARLRAYLAESAVERGDIGVVREAAPADRPDVVAHLLGIGSWSARSRSALEAVAADPVRVVVLAALAPEYVVQ